MKSYFGDMNPFYSILAHIINIKQISSILSNIDIL